MKKNYLLVGLLAFTSHSFAYANIENKGIFMNLDSFSHSEPISIYGLLNEWDGKLSSGKRVFSTNSLELGFEVNQWQFSILNRQDYYFELASDTAELIYKSKNKDALEPGRSYKLELDANSFSAKGFKVGYQIEHSSYKLGISASYLQASELMSGDLVGQAQALSDKDYNYSFTTDYYYSEDVLFGRSLDESVLAQGYAFDLNFDMDINDRLNINIQAKDLFARLYWQDTPRTVAEASSATKEFDNEGFVKFNPVASGTESNKDFTQVIPTKLFVKGAYKTGHSHTFLASYAHYQIKDFISLGYVYDLDMTHQISLEFILNAKALKASYQNDWLQASIVSDAFNLRDAKTLGLSLSGLYRF